MKFKYLIDANIFIQAKNFHYGFDTFPGFWKWLDSENKNHLICSINKICDELMNGNDDLAAWAKARRTGEWFLSVDDEETQSKLSEIANWVVHPKQGFTERASADFLSKADPWLIAKASVIDATVVTHEKFNADRKNKVQIPNVCRAFSVEYVDIFDLIRKTGVKFGMQ
jgi:hypothetical protein